MNRYRLQKVNLDEVITLQRGFDLPAKNRQIGNVPVVASTGIIGNHKEAKVKGPGVVIGRSGSIGGGQYIKEDFWPLNTTLWVKDYKSNDVLFVYYLLKSIDFLSFNTGSGVPTLNRNHLHSLKVFLPTLERQKKIAKILGDLDQKIENNRQMNETLEQMGQALFKHYFIDNPEAKGWPPKKLGDYITLVNGTSYKSSELQQSDNALVTLKSFNRGGGFRRDGFKQFLGKIKDEQIVHDGDVVVAHTDVTQEAEVAGVPALVSGTNSYNKVGISMDVVKVVPKNDDITTGLLYFLIQSKFFQEHKKGYISGTTVLHLNKKCLHNFIFRWPSEDLINTIAPIFQNIAETIAQKEDQIEDLSAMRETLLPRLISGRIEV